MSEPTALAAAATNMGVSQERAQALLRAARQVRSLSGMPESTIADAATDPASDAAVDDLRQRIDTVLSAHLTSREAHVLRSRFGFTTGASMTLKEIGRELGVTRERIRQIEAKALKKLRVPSATQRLDGFFGDDTPRDGLQQRHLPQSDELAESSGSKTDTRFARMAAAVSDSMEQLKIARSASLIEAMVRGQSER